MAQEHIFLSLLPADRTDRRLAFAVAAVSLLIFVAIAPFAKVPLGRTDAFIPIYQSGVLINDLITAVLLFGQFGILRSSALLALACGYLFTALMVVAHTMSFPGLFASGGLLGGGPQTTAWLYVFWHGGFPLAVIAYALLKGRDKAQPAMISSSGAVLICVAAVIAIAVGLVLLATVGHEFLPSMMQGNVMIPAKQKVIIVSTWSFSLVALLVLLWKCRPYAVLDVWLMVVCFIWLCEIALSSILNAARFDLGFYAGRAYGFVAASFVLVVLLLENAKLYSQLAHSHAEVTAAKTELDRYARGLEGQVQDSEEKYRLFLEQALDVILVLDAQGTVIEANRQAETIFGQPHQSIVGRPLASLVATLESPDRIADYKALLTTPSHSINGLLVTAAEKREVELDIVSTRVQVDHQSRILVIARDVTERRKLEQQLRQSQKMEAIGQLTGGLAHDFNNLLAIVVGNLDLLSEQNRNPTDHELVKTALDAALQGAELTRQLLAFSRKQPLQARRCDMNILVGDMLKLLRRTLGEQIEVVFNPGSSLPPVLIDAAQLGSAVANLATNARDAMPEGGRLTFTTQRSVLDEDYAAINPDAVPGNYVLLMVADNGVGIPPESLARVFDPFFTTKPVGKGTGLGLSMVFGFVKQSGGHIKIYSEVGKGTVIRIYLPEVVDNPDRVDASGAAVPAGSSGGETVVIVDDNLSVRGVASKQLAKLGYRVLEADTPAAALEYFRNGARVDLLFTDIVMPGGMNGRELAQAATALQPGLRVLFTSGFPGGAMATSAQLQPDEAFLGKPYRLHELAQKLREVLDRRG